jgi:hypothetical protein
MFIAITELRQQSHLAGGFLNTTLCGGLRSASAPPYLQAPHYVGLHFYFFCEISDQICERRVAEIKISSVPNTFVDHPAHNF